MDDNAKTTPPKVDRETLIACANHGERGAGLLFAKLHQNKFLAEKVASRNGSKNLWYHFNGQFWEQDMLERVAQAISSMQNLFLDEIKRIQSDREHYDKNAEAVVDVMEKAAFRLDRHSFLVNASLFAAEGDGSLGFIGDGFDQQKFKVPCENGILDPAKCDIDENGRIVLESKKAWRPMRPDDYVRSVCAPFNIEAECPEWEKFLTDALDGDTHEGREVIDFLQILAGYTLLGDPRQDVFVIKDSPNGRSGKGVFDKMLLRAFGTLGVTAKSSLFLKKSGNDPHKPEPAVMALKNKRLAVMSEQGKGEVYDAAEVKTKTSGRDAVSSRGLYGEQINFLPTYVFWQSTNDLPRISADDGAFWARVIRIKFPHHYVANPNPEDPTQKQIDTGLEARLEAEISGILNWVIIGAIKYIQAGYQLPKYPKLVADAIAEYRQHEDNIADFIADCCITGARYEVKSGELYENFKNWCNETGRRISSQKTFVDAMKRKGFTSERRKLGVYFIGLGIVQR